MGRCHTACRRARRMRAAGLWLASAAGLGLAAPSSARAAPEPADGPPLVVTPTIGLEEVLTDNARLTETGRRADSITRGLFGLDAVLQSGRATGRLTGEVAYDRYARDAKLSGLSLNADGSAALSIIPDELTLEAQGAVVDGRVSTFGAPAIDRTGVPDRVQVATYQVGPRLNAKLGDFADLAAAARFAQVLYAAGASSNLRVPLPDDDGVGQLVASLDTGERLAGREFLTTGRYEHDQLGFETATAAQSAYVSVAPRLRVIGRAGYESVRQRGVIDLDAPLLSAGLEYKPNAASTISLEGGRRYDRPNWAAKADVALGGRLFLSARYEETIQPDQLLLVGSFADYVEEVRTLAPPLIPGRFTPEGNVYQQTSYNKAGSLAATYTREDQTLRASVFEIDRDFLPSHDHDRTLAVDVSYRRDIHADLSLTLQGGYQQTFDSPVYGRSRSYEVQAQLAYRINSTTDFNATYAYADNRQFDSDRTTLRENGLLFALRKRV